MIIQLLYNLYKSRKAGLNDAWLYIILTLLVLGAAILMIRYFGSSGDKQITYITGTVGDSLTSRG